MESKEIKVYGTFVNYTQGTITDANHNDMLMKAYQLYDDRFGATGINNYQDVINKRLTAITYANGVTTITGDLVVTGKTTTPNLEVTNQFVYKGQTFDPSTMATDITSLKQAVEILNGNESVPNSVKNIAAQYIANVVNNAPAAFDTLKEIADWIANAENGQATGSIAARIAALENKVQTLEGLWTDNGTTLTAKSGRSVTGAGFYDSTIS